MLDSLIELLPLEAQKVAKTIVTSVGSILFVVLGMVEDAPNWMFIVLAVLTTGAVYGVPNKATVASKSNTSTTGLEASQDLPEAGIKNGDDVEVVNRNLEGQ